MNPMRILVGTLYTIENEFDACCAAIARQTLPAAEHLIIRNKPNKEAHDTLYGTFARRRDEFDLLIKVDADMVLARDTVFEEIVEQFARSPDLDLLKIGLHDFFTDRLIGSLNAYRNIPAWGSDAVFTDSVGVPATRTRIDMSDLAPVADHCPDPSPFQAFHFGVHKGVKAAHALDHDLHARLEEHLGNIEATWQHFRRNPDPRLGLATLGGELALRGDYAIQHVDYDHPFLEAEFNTRYAASTSAQFRSMVEALRRTRWGWLPWRLRMEALRGSWGRFTIRLILPPPLIHQIARCRNRHAG